MKNRKFSNTAVKNVYDSYPRKITDKLLVLRELIFRIAGESDEIGQIEETLKWDNPSYLTHGPKSGTTIRLSPVGHDDEKCALSVHCQTSLVADFRQIYPELQYDGNRSVLFDVNVKLPLATIEHFISAALTYHHRKRLGIGI
ncbi:MAG: DUF1801 domain-containing protein [Gammaproteobacteria bacterium]|nr:DUF1801 domain-containing protein [Gammaproteobacteria bacterium]